jgi:hypothetical protein
MSGLAEGDCGVCIGGGGDGDPVDFWVEKMVTARKSHQCYECNQPILPGSRYERIAMKYEGDINTYELCSLCSEIGKAFSCDGRMLGILWDDIHDTLFPQMTTGCLAKLTTAAAKQHLVKKWQAWKFPEAA